MTRWKTRVTALLVILLLLWRLMSAPISPMDWQGLQTALWQAQALLPSRLARTLLLWPLAAPSDKAGKLDQPSPAADAIVLQVYNADSAALLPQSLETYVFCVVAAEMPASYHMEALKAQAVAARTRAVSQRLSTGGSGCTLHPDADICTDSTHCQAYADDAACRALWGEAYAAYHQRVQDAVTQTAGQILTYDGKPITVMYHAISGGHTEDVQAVFSRSLPYLVGVESDGEEDARGFYTDASFTYEEAAAKLLAYFPDAAITAQNLRSRIAVSTHTQTGRVDTLLLGTGEVSVTDVRKALGLRSTWFTLSLDDDRIVFHQQGYGHGVGMSQAGANHMAACGSTFDEILAHYYSGVTLTQVS